MICRPSTRFRRCSLFKRANQREQRPTNCLRQIAPGSNHSLQISVMRRRFEPIRATKMQRRCSAALLAIHATARQNIGCVGIECGFDPRGQLHFHCHFGRSGVLRWATRGNTALRVGSDGVANRLRSRQRWCISSPIPNVSEKLEQVAAQPAI